MMLLPQLYGIIGSPLGHSLSPLLHGTAFAALGLPAVYLPWEIAPEHLQDFVRSVRLLNIQGCSVTLPHKVNIIPLLDRVSERVKLMGACNTLYRDGALVCGDNTDILGFMAPLRELPLPQSALLLGAGGAARAAVAGLRLLGVSHITLSNRNPERGQQLAEELDITFLPWEKRAETSAGLIINTTSLGMTGSQEADSPLPASAFRGTGIAYDIIYTPLQTRFLRDAAAAGWQTVSGLAMFIGQADAQYRLWTGQPLPESAVQAVTEALQAREGSLF